MQTYSILTFMRYVMTVNKIQYFLTAFSGFYPQALGSVQPVLQTNLILII